jgi:hypothetical protein
MRALLRNALPNSIVAFALLGAWATSEFSPTFHQRQLQEDGVVEWATFFAFLIAAAVATRQLLRTHGRTLDRVALLGVGLFCVFVAGEEISWGQRILGFKPPDVFLEHNYQQETNLHNFLKTILDTRWIVLFIALVYGVFAPLVARRWKLLAPLAPAIGVAPSFAIVAFLEGFYPFELSGELAELLLGLCFLTDVLLRSHETSIRRLLGAQLVAITLGIVGTPLIERMLYGDATVRVAECRAELELLRKDLARAQVLEKKLLTKRRVHKRLYTATRSRYLRLGPDSEFLEGSLSPAESHLAGARRDRRGFFLDPWNQPYWILFLRDRDGVRRLLIYSFGPNRRRDSALESIRAEGMPSALFEDDLGVIVEVGSEDVP